MIAVTANFTTKSGNKHRLPQYKVEFDWDLTANLQDETKQVKVIEVERSVNEPLGGVALAQADIRFANDNNRYTPRKDS